MPTKEVEEAELLQRIEDVVTDFDPDNNETDRLIFYMVSGRQLIEGEFERSDSSDEEWARLREYDPLANAFSYRETMMNDEKRISLME